MAQPTAQDFRDLLKAADVESDRIAAVVQQLSDAVKPGMTDEEANEIKAGMQGLVDELKAIGKTAPNPNPGP